MSRVIVIRIEVPEGVTVRVAGGTPDDDDIEPLPPPWAPSGEPAMAVLAPTGARNGSAIGSCPIHHLAWRSGSVR